MNKKIICIIIIALFLLTSAASASIVIGINAYEMGKSVGMESVLVNDDSFDGYTLLNPWISTDTYLIFKSKLVFLGQT